MREKFIASMSKQIYKLIRYFDQSLLGSEPDPGTVIAPAKVTPATSTDTTRRFHTPLFSCSVVNVVLGGSMTESPMPSHQVLGLYDRKAMFATQPLTANVDIWRDKDTFIQNRKSAADWETKD
ncbi:hypothetical protein NC653_039696 [Populus alba x Populus x berolinensis]|uniref:Uncharacterized protein n=1 Tax=Populus alba x Populus x berolinensis TaxID=444605 RepID=A0AAD6LEF7_9ROSI|nr:hypothetical protein NC653_039696 [Populus alba x Populus x berolinensis]